MRICCRKCGAEYELHWRLIGARGRVVECSGCGHEWVQLCAAPEAPRPTTAAESPRRATVVAAPTEVPRHRVVGARAAPPSVDQVSHRPPTAAAPRHRSALRPVAMTGAVVALTFVGLLSATDFRPFYTLKHKVISLASTSASAADLSPLVSLPEELRARLPAPVSDDDYHPVSLDEARLGQLLFFDPLLSGNRDIACATCHHPQLNSGDGVSLGLGTGAVGLGPDRRATGPHAADRRIPRNAPKLFNLGAREFHTLFHDGRVSVNEGGPLRWNAPHSPEVVHRARDVLAAQALFPVLSPEEMAGRAHENEIGRAVAAERFAGPDGAWELIAARIGAIPDYAAGFAALNPEIAAGRAVSITDIANALSAFMAFEFRSDHSPFDRALRGEASLAPLAVRGADLFYGRAGCHVCHAGPFQTDHDFHPMGQPQLGPGKNHDPEAYTRDIGRMAVTGDPEDAYAFRTPSLRNVLHSGPWGHAGAFSDLRGFLAHHLDPVAGLARYRPQAVLPELDSAVDDWSALAQSEERAAIAAAAARRFVNRPPVLLQGEDVAALMAFLESLSDPAALVGRMGTPDRVPSGLPVDR